ncbi:uncharacterized protein LTR77_008170 [Saxophila tyrrhenica]|uniref:Uncharacterized protein n=1 Tax=Saxophila tyrrhenica TaxID=1690608 RepID=A0AAV9P5T9_9PEZI|nr:hypothetical protein LTR77_008170 [Saxophila tyrrhenica]
MSWPSEGESAPPKRKVGRPRKSKAAGSQTLRKRSTSGEEDGEARPAKHFKRSSSLQATRSSSGGAFATSRDPFGDPSRRAAGPFDIHSQDAIKTNEMHMSTEPDASSSTVEGDAKASETRTFPNSILYHYHDQGNNLADMVSRCTHGSCG